MPLNGMVCNGRRPHALKTMLLRQGTSVDATIIHAPSSTKNKNKARDPDMHQPRKANRGTSA